MHALPEAGWHCLQTVLEPGGPSSHRGDGWAQAAQAQQPPSVRPPLGGGLRHLPPRPHIAKERSIIMNHQEIRTMSDRLNDVLAEMDEEGPMRYLVVKESSIQGQPCMTLVKEFKTLRGAWKFAHRNRKPVWLFAARFEGPMTRNGDLFDGEVLAT